MRYILGVVQAVCVFNVFLCCLIKLLLLMLLLHMNCPFSYSASICRSVFFRGTLTVTRTVKGWASVRFFHSALISCSYSFFFKGNTNYKSYSYKWRTSSFRLRYSDSSVPVRQQGIYPIPTRHTRLFQTDFS